MESGGGEKSEKGKHGYSNYLWLCEAAELCAELLILGLTGLDKQLCGSGSVLDPDNTEANVQTASEGTGNLRCIIKEHGFQLSQETACN